MGAEVMAPPPLKFAGSKTGSLADLDDHFRALGLPRRGFAYYEPMCGSLAVGLHVLEAYEPSEAHFADASPDLINFYVQLTHHYPRLAARARELVGDGLDEHAYYALRDRLNARADPPAEAAAQFFVLNRACFNGVYRVNRAGRYNVPYGRFPDGLCKITPAMWAQLHRAHELLSKNRVTFECVDVEAFLRRHAAALADSPSRPSRPSLPSLPSLLYCDPPYVGSHALYHHAGKQFDLAKQARLRRAMDAWAAAGAHVLASNSNCDAVWALYEGWQITPVVVNRRISARVESRGEGRHDVLLCPGAATRSTSAR